MKREDFLERQIRTLAIAAVPMSVGNALAAWADWMRGDVVSEGLPSSSAGFATGGISCWDDLEEEGHAYAGAAVDVAVRKLDVVPRTCIEVIWLGHSYWENKRLDLEVTAAKGIEAIYLTLCEKGVC